MDKKHEEFLKTIEPFVDELNSLLAKIGDIAKEYGCKKAVAEILEDEGIL
jgi:hypothetical protein